MAQRTLEVLTLDGLKIFKVEERLSVGEFRKEYGVAGELSVDVGTAKTKKPQILGDETLVKNLPASKRLYEATGVVGGYN